MKSKAESEHTLTARLQDRGPTYGCWRRGWPDRVAVTAGPTHSVDTDGGQLIATDEAGPSEPRGSNRRHVRGRRGRSMCPSLFVPSCTLPVPPTPPCAAGM